MIFHSIKKNSVILTLFAFCASGLLALTYTGTKSKITEAEIAAAQKALYEIIPKNLSDNDVLNDTWLIPNKALEKLIVTAGSKIHLVRNKGEIIGVIMPTTAPDGYSGDIHIMVGIYRDGRIAGTRVLGHKETPGLGDKIEWQKSDWILTFNGKSLENTKNSEWAVTKDGGIFDQFTGATITPRAVVNKVRHALEYYQVNKQHLLSLPEKQAQEKDASNEWFKRCEPQRLME